LGRVAGLEIVAKRLSELDLMSLSLQPATLLSELCRFLLLTSLRAGARARTHTHTHVERKLV